MYVVNLKGRQYLNYSSFWLNWRGKYKEGKIRIKP